MTQGGGVGPLRGLGHEGEHSYMGLRASMLSRSVVSDSGFSVDGISQAFPFCGGG